jgi:hypothetical protein
VIVVGNPHWIDARSDSRAAGLAVAVARAVRRAGADVQLVGKVGEDPAGEAILLDLAHAGIGHVALLRDAGVVTPASAEASEGLDLDSDMSSTESPSYPPDVPGLDAGDIELALRYLTDYRVIVVAQPLDSAALGAAISAAAWSNAALVVLVSSGREPPAGLPDTATVFEAPADDHDDTFAGMVGRYAAALDRGEDPARAFAAVTTESGWAPASVDEA